jgi:hypothetical protein
VPAAVAAVVCTPAPARISRFGQTLHLLGNDILVLGRKAGNVSARLGEARYEAGADGVNQDGSDDDGDTARRLPSRLDPDTPGHDDDAALAPDELGRQLGRVTEA